jgi:DNA repair protein RadA/Sms
VTATRSVFVCQSCAAEHPRWFGKCPSCDAWNSLTEEIRRKPVKKPGRSVGGLTGLGGSLAPERPTAGGAAPEPTDLSQLTATPLERIETGIGEFDRVLGGGFVPGEAILLGGDPGIGKSTLLLQVATELVRNGIRVLYVSGEESAGQIHLRARRLGAIPDGLFVVAETDLGAVLDLLAERHPTVAIIDSIQTMRHAELGSIPGSVAQVRECALSLIGQAKSGGAAVILVGHVTKDGLVAGPKTLEHMVDAVVHLEGDRFHHYRILRAAKNRFGATHEVGVFEMRDDGLAEVPNPSEALLGERGDPASGVAVVASLEGTRPLLVEVQALVAPKAFSYPQRVTTGFEARRLALLLAVLGQRCGVDLTERDVFVSVAGGFTLDDPAVDLGMAVAVAGAHRGLPLDHRTVYLGEIGLGGEIRRVKRADLRLREAQRLGFACGVLPAANEAECRMAKDAGLDLIPVKTLGQALDAVFGPSGGGRRAARTTARSEA